MYVQYPDLTEIKMYALAGWDGSAGYEQVGQGILPIKTEFAFGVERKNGPDNPHAIKCGFKPLKAMMNWWPTHHGEPNFLKFYWYKNPNPNKEKPPAYRCHWGGNSRYPHLSKLTQATGCGFKLGELPLKKLDYYHYFTLLRLPLRKKLSKTRLNWLKCAHFTFLDEGSLASFWVNGWDAKGYKQSIELDYWEKHHGNLKYINYNHTNGTEIYWRDYSYNIRSPYNTPWGRELGAKFIAGELGKK